MSTDNNLTDQIDIGKIIRILLMQSKMILLIILIGSSLAITYFINAPKIYNIKSLLHIDDNKSSLNDDITMNAFMGLSSQSALEDLKVLYKTRSNLLKVTKDLKLNIFFQDDQFKNLKKNIINFHIDFDEEEKYKSYFLKFGSSGYELFNNNKDLLFEAQYNEQINNNGIEILISKPNQPFNEFIQIYYYSPESLFKFLQEGISISDFSTANSWYKSSGIIQISINSHDRSEAKKIINLTNEIFINENIRTETEKARKAIEFLDERIMNVTFVLDENKTRLKDFQQNNSSINVDLEIQSIIEKIAEIEGNIRELDLKIAESENMYTSDNPLFIKLVKQKAALIDQKVIIENDIKKLPLAQQEFIDLYTDVQISQDLYSELLNRKLGFSIVEASTIGNIRVIDEAYVDKQVSPTFSVIILSFLFSTFLGIIFAIIRGTYFASITNPAEIEDNNIKYPMLGVIPKHDDIDSIQDKPEDDNKFSQSIESLIVNINSSFDEHHDQARVIMLTSPTPENGKTFLSFSLASSLSKYGSKVLLLDHDFKRGDLHKIVGGDKITYTNFRDISDENINEFFIKENFAFIPKISKLLSSFEFINNSEYSKKFEYFKNKFDYIIIDTAPILSVSDTAMLASKADRLLLIARHNKTKISEINQASLIIKQTGIDFDGLIYNHYERPRSYYGYYGLYGSYNYQYYANKYLYQSYDYDNE